MKKILIIGSLGYLGSALSDYFHNYGYQCVGSDIGFFQYGILYRPQPLVMLNAEARTLTENDLAGFDVVVLFAGMSNDPFGKLSDKKIYHPTREYAIAIAKMCKKLGIRYIFPSSCSVYGTGNGLLDEFSTPNPLTPYSRNKLEIEQDLAQLADKDFSPIALRLGTVFGISPRIRFDVIINMLCGMAITQKQVILNSDGKAWRPHVYIEDICQAIKCAIDWEYNAGDLLVLNVGRDDNNLTILEVAKLVVSQISGCELCFLNELPEHEVDDLIKDRKLQDGVDSRNYQVSFANIHKILPGFQAKWTVEQGVVQLLADLQRLQLDSIKFKQREFYRLQQMEYLYQTRQINDALFWH